MASHCGSHLNAFCFHVSDDWIAVNAMPLAGDHHHHHHHRINRFQRPMNESRLVDFVWADCIRRSLYVCLVCSRSVCTYIWCLRCDLIILLEASGYKSFVALPFNSKLIACEVVRWRSFPFWPPHKPQKVVRVNVSFLSSSLHCKWLTEQVVEWNKQVAKETEIGHVKRTEIFCKSIFVYRFTWKLD